MAQQEAQNEIDRLAQLVRGYQGEEFLQRTHRATEAILRSVPSFSDEPSTLFRDHEATINRYFRTRATYLVDETLKKNCLLESLRGRALLRIRENPELDRVYLQGTYEEYLSVICSVFQPDSEKVLVRSEFDQYVQKRNQDISSYFSNKLTLFRLAFLEQERSYDYLRVSVLAGIINKEVRLEVRRKNPRDIEALRQAVIEATASERDAFSGGYSNSASADGLSTISNVRRQMEVHQGEEPMEIDQLTAGDRKCHRCGRTSHLKKDCIAKTDSKGGVITDTKTRSFTKPGGRGRGGGQSRNPTGQREKTCYTCGKAGHLKRDCRSRKPINSAMEEAEEEDEDCWEPTVNFLGFRPTGKQGRKHQH